MNSEDVDKLFNERLGKLSPKPSADLWNRLQDRIEDELPVKDEKKPVLMWARSYSVAAAITILLSAGVVIFNVQQDVKQPAETLAQVEQPQVTKDAGEAGKPDNWVNKSVAVATEEVAQEPGTAIAGESIETSDVRTEEPVVKTQIQKRVQNSEKKEPVTIQRKSTMLAAASKPVLPEPEPVRTTMPETSVAFASARTDMNAAPVEIIIKRTVASQSAEPVMAEEDSDSDFQKTKTLAKNIFKQVKNLSNGEQVNLSEVGINANKIALETQIGKQKISKVINL